MRVSDPVSDNIEVTMCVCGFIFAVHSWWGNETERASAMWSSQAGEGSDGGRANCCCCCYSFIVAHTCPSPPMGCSSSAQGSEKDLQARIPRSTSPDWGEEENSLAFRNVMQALKCNSSSINVLDIHMGRLLHKEFKKTKYERVQCSIRFYSYRPKFILKISLEYNFTKQFYKIICPC